VHKLFFCKIVLGAMIYNDTLKKGVKKNVPEPNPQKVELRRTCTLDKLFHKANELYFHNEALVSSMNLGDSSGLIVNVDKSNWILETYYKDNDYKPSRHRLYVILDEAKVYND
jgi:hypothetical protein